MAIFASGIVIMQIPPIPRLAHLVRHFLILESPAPQRTIHRLIPDGNPGIVFNYGAGFEGHGESFGRYSAPIQSYGDSSGLLPVSFVYGQVTRPHPLVSTGDIGAFIVVLRPYALALLTGLPANSFTDRVVPLGQVWRGEATELERQLHRAAGDQQRLDLVQRFLLQRHARLPDPMIIHSLEWLKSQETPGIEALATELEIGRRTLERVFQTTVGIPPKQFAGILRTQHFLKALHQQESLTQLAYKFGYYDQSHLIRDFKMKTGITPGKYFAARDALALNFIQFAE